MQHVLGGGKKRENEDADVCQSMGVAVAGVVGVVGVINEGRSGMKRPTVYHRHR